MTDQDCQIVFDDGIPEVGAVLMDTCNEHAWVQSNAIVKVQEAR